MGSIFRRKGDGRWVASVSSGPRDKRRRIVRYRKTRKEAEAALDDIRKLVPAPGSGKATVGAYLRSWLDVAGRRSLKPSTWRTYDVALRRHIDPAIGHLSLARLTAEHVDMMLATSELEPKGQRNVLGFLGRVLDVAMKRGYVVRNAARLVDPPRVSSDEPEALTPEQAKRIMAAVKGDRLEALWILALCTGMRQAELLGLRWSDIDLAGGTLRVVFSLTTDADGAYALDDPKTPRSRRTIALPGLAVRALEAHKVRQDAEKVVTPIKAIDGLVFMTEPGHVSKVDPEGLGGRPLNQGWVSHRWPVLARKAGVEVTMHGLRHGQSSLLVAAGVHPRLIASRLGHSTIAQSMDRYAHVAETSDRDVAALLDEALG